MAHFVPNRCNTPKSYGKEPEWSLSPYFRLARFNERIGRVSNRSTCLNGLRGRSVPTMEGCRHASQVRWTPRILSLCPGCLCFSAVLCENFRFSHGQRLRRARLCDVSRRTSGLIAVLRRMVRSASLHRTMEMASCTSLSRFRPPSWRDAKHGLRRTESLSNRSACGSRWPEHILSGSRPPFVANCLARRLVGSIDVVPTVDE
jgi:hypothetical protein